MNKQILNNCKDITYLILLCLILLQSCRKETILPSKGPDGLTIAEAKSYFEDKFKITNTSKGKIMSTGRENASGNLSSESFFASKRPLWDKAYEKTIATGQSVKVPIDFGGAYTVINPATGAAIPMNSLNYLFMYKDSSQVVHVEWVILEPDSAWLYGSRSNYTGLITVRDWRGKVLKKFSYGHSLNNTFSAIRSGSKGKLAVGENSSGLVSGYVCIRISTGKCPESGPCSASYCDMCTAICAQQFCAWSPPDCSPVCDLPPVPGTGGGEDGGGGGNPTLPGGGGVYPPDPCGGGGTSIPHQTVDEDLNSIPLPPCIPIPVVLESLGKSRLISILGITPTLQQSIYLSANPDLVNALLSYLDTNGETEQNIEFSRWAFDYLYEYPQNYSVFVPLLMNNGNFLSYENVQIESGGTTVSANDYAFAGLSAFFTETEFNAVIQNLSNDFNEDPIQLYMIACYKNSKLLNSSTYSKPNHLQIGEYTLTPHYNLQGQLIFYSAFRKASLGIEYLIRADGLNAFKDRYTIYKAAADLFYVNGKPTFAQIQISAGDYWEGLGESLKNAFSNPYYYLYLGHLFIGTATNVKTIPATNEPIKYTSVSIRNTNKVSIKIENRTMNEFKDMVSQKYNASWQDVGAGRYKLEIGQNRYVSNPASTSLGEPTIYYFRNNVDIGRFRFNN